MVTPPPPATTLTPPHNASHHHAPTTYAPLADQTTPRACPCITHASCPPSHLPGPLLRIPTPIRVSRALPTCPALPPTRADPFVHRAPSRLAPRPPPTHPHPQPCIPSPCPHIPVGAQRAQHVSPHPVQGEPPLPPSPHTSPAPPALLGPMTGGGANPVPLHLRQMRQSPLHITIFMYTYTSLYTPD